MASLKKINEKYESIGERKKIKLFDKIKRKLLSLFLVRKLFQNKIDKIAFLYIKFKFKKIIYL